MKASLSRRVHSIAASGFDAALHVDAYDRWRPSYPPAAIEMATAGVSAKGRVLDVACGTGKLTAPLLDIFDEVECVEPARRMREFFEERHPGVRVYDAAVENLPMQDNRYDAVFVGQAFHWFDTVAALREMARVLKPGGRLALLWNLEDSSTEWVARVRQAYERFDGEAPQYRKGEWRKVWESAEAAAWFERPQEEVFAHSTPMTKDGVWERILSKSYIGLLEAEVREQLKGDIEEIVQDLPESFHYPQLCRVVRTATSEADGQHSHV